MVLDPNVVACVGFMACKVLRPKKVWAASYDFNARVSSSISSFWLVSCVVPFVMPKSLIFDPNYSPSMTRAVFGFIFDAPICVATLTCCSIGYCKLEDSAAVAQTVLFFPFTKHDLFLWLLILVAVMWPS